MSVRNLLYLTFGLLLLALGLQAFVSVLQSQEDEVLERAEDRRLVSYRLADELRQSSDDLTRFARTYTQTNDERYARYFRQILQIRDGYAPRPIGYQGVYWDYVASSHTQPSAVDRQVSLLDLMREAGFSDEEFAKLEEAKSRSDKLAELEKRAMNAMRGRFPTSDVAGFEKREPDPELARRLMHGEEYHAAKASIMRPIEEFFDLVTERTRADVAAHRAHAGALARTSIGITIGAGILALVLLVRLLRRMVAPVHGVSERLHDMAEDLERASGEQQAGASQQSASVEETRQTFAQLLEATRGLARIGTDVLQNAQSAQSNARSIGNRIEELSSSTKTITEVLRLVKDIANKSEILALNAALEGSKAGEAGRGFSLVASQMQRLAEQVMMSAKKIESLTAQIETSGHNAVLAAEEAEKVSALTTSSAREIAEAVNFQQSGAQQIATAMDEISSVAQQNVDAARQTVERANDLMGVSTSLQKTLRGGHKHP